MTTDRGNVSLVVGSIPTAFRQNKPDVFFRALQDSTGSKPMGTKPNEPFGATAQIVLAALCKAEVLIERPRLDHPKRLKIRERWTHVTHLADHHQQDHEEIADVAEIRGSRRWQTSIAFLKIQQLRRTPRDVESPPSPLYLGSGLACLRVDLPVKAEALWTSMLTYTHCQTHNPPS